MSTSCLVNPEGINISNANFDNLTQDPTPLLQQQSCAAGTSLSIPAVNSGLDNTAIAPPPFDVSFVKSSGFVENCYSNPIQAVLLHVLLILQPITTVTTVAPQRLTATLSLDSSLSTKIFPTSELLGSVESSGTNFFCKLSSQTAPCSTEITTTSCQQSLLSIDASPFMRTMGQAAPVAPGSLTVQDLAQL